jgi:N-acetyl-alpha-D-muramate 1-phosphate uridylyltransferase
MNTALIFAAGRGSRLRPLTNTLPKALCPINDTPLIDYHLEKLAESNIERVFVNHAYLGDQIKYHINQKKYNNLEIIYIPEPPGGFRTGGTIINLLPYFNNTPFLAINADVYTDYDLRALKHPKTSLAHLVLIKTPADHLPADFGLTDTHLVSNQNPHYTFTGIASYHPQLFEGKARGRAALSPWLRDAAEKNQITGEVHSGLWFDTGTPERFKRACTAAKKAS